MDANPDEYKDEAQPKKQKNIVAEFGAENDQLNIKVQNTKQDVFEKAHDVTPPE